MNLLDRPEVLQVLFHPRGEYGAAAPAPAVRPVAVEVEPNLTVGGRLYPARADAPAILLYHGNGEIAADYDQIARLYTHMDITLLVVDYRGYGRSRGTPTASNLLADAVTVFDALGRLLKENGLSPSRLYVMGRSLGSAAAIEVASHSPGQLAGLIIESGFSDTFALLARLGVGVRGADEERDGFGSGIKMARVTTRSLIIHGGADVLIPSADGRKLYDRCAADDKRWVLIPGGGHNDLMMVGLTAYLEAIREFVHAE
jgi:hypothetical protein